jgi:hypothetical protein
MREVGELVVGLDALGRGLDRAHIGGLGHRAGLAGELLVFLHQRERGHLRTGVFPRDLQRIAALLGGPVAVGDDGHARAPAIGRDLQHVDHTLHGLGRRRVVLGHLATKARRAGEHRHFHVRQARIETELHRAIELRARVQARRGLADNTELRRVLQRDLRRHRQRHRGLRQLAVGGTVAARGDHAAGGVARRRIDLPALSRGRNQHRAGARAEFAILLERVVQRGRAARHLDAEERVLVRIGGRREHAAHVAPVDVELFSQRHRQRGVHALAEFQPVHRHRDGVVRRDDDERLRRRRRLGLRVLRAGQHRRDAEREATACQRGEFQEAATIECRRASVGGHRLMLSAATSQRLKIADTHVGFSGGAQASDLAAS